MKRYIGDIVAIGVIILIVIIFLLHLFYPTLRLVVTPDYGRIDAWHFSFSTKYLLWQFLQKNQLPFWTPLLGGGFPMFAEGQIGALFLPNLIFYKVFSPVIAYNASIALTLITFGFGLYVWLRAERLSPYTALFSAMTGTFSGIMVTHLTHITLLQSLSLLPLLMLCTTKIISTQKRIWIYAFAFVLSQQLFAGFPQATFLTLCLSGTYIVWQYLRNKLTLQRVARFCIAVTFGLLLATPQLLSSYEFLQESSYPHGFPQNLAAYYSFPLKHIVSLFSPYIFGNPQNGTYTLDKIYPGSIFWENTAYIGILPLFFAAYSFFTHLSLKRKKYVQFLYVVAGISFILMVGKYSPLYLVFSFWPLNLFRVPSRFIWPFTLSLLWISAFSLEYIYNKLKTWPWKRALFGILIALQVGQLFSTWKDYNAFDTASYWTKPPASTEFISSRDTILTLGDSEVHNDIFLTHGWQQITPYRDLLNGLSPNGNVLYSIKQRSGATGRYLARSAILDGLIYGGIESSDTVSTISAQGKKALDIAGVTTIIGMHTVQGPKLINRGHVPVNRETATIYSNTGAVPQWYITGDVRVARSVERAVELFADDSFIPGTSVIVEKQIADIKNTGEARVYPVSQADSQAQVKTTSTNGKKILVFVQTYYPSWKATIDNKPTDVFPVNIGQIGIVVPEGTHQIALHFEPTAYIRGIGIVIATIFGISVLECLLLAISWPRTRP